MLYYFLQNGAGLYVMVMVTVVRQLLIFYRHIDIVLADHPEWLTNLVYVSRGLELNVVNCSSILIGSSLFSLRKSIMSGCIGL
jgi:hypothetical protein